MGKDENEDPKIIRWKRQERVKLFWVLFRWGLGVPMVLFSIQLLGLFPGVLFVTIGAVMIVPELSSFLSGWAGSFMWSDRAGEQGPLCGVARSLASKGEYEKAFEAFRQQAEKFPQHVNVYIEMLDLVLLKMRNVELAKQVRADALKIIEKPEARRKLRDAFIRITAQIEVDASQKDLLQSNVSLSQQMLNQESIQVRTEEETWRDKVAQCGFKDEELLREPGQSDGTGKTWREKVEEASRETEK